MTPDSQTMLDNEKQLSSQYVIAGHSLITAVLHNPSEAPTLLGPISSFIKTSKRRSRRPPIS